MKSIIKYAGLSFIFICTFLISLNLNFLNRQKTEIQEALSFSLRNTLKSSTLQPMYDVNEVHMQVECIRYLANLLHSDSTYEVFFHGVNPEGLLDVTLRSNYQHLNGKKTKEEVRKTLLVENYK